MNIELLKTFLEVSKTRHFGRAAELLYLTQSAVSFRIKQLESKLGVTLLNRHRNNIHLTPAGERLIPYANNLLNTWKIAKKEVIHTKKHPKLSIGASASLWETYLTSWIKLIYQIQPDIHLDIRIAPRNMLIKQLYEHQLDILITTEVPKIADLISKPIGHISLKIVKSSKTNFDQNNKYQFIKLDWGIDFFIHDHENLIQIFPILITSSAHLTRHLLPLINACALLPIHWTDLYKEELTALSNFPIISRSLCAIWLPTNDHQTQIHQLLNLTKFIQ
ncbi:MAG: HTH-type transcriptional regulator HdfR [Candidatus Dasytiphilus stammeri]